MKKIFAIVFSFVCAVSFYHTVHADIIPPGKNPVSYCTKIINSKDFPEKVFIGSVKFSSVSSYIIKDDTCLDKGYKFATFSIYVAPKEKILENDTSDTITAKIAGFDLVDDSYIRNEAGSFVSKDNPLSKIVEILSLTQDSSGKFSLKKITEIKSFNNGSPDQIIQITEKKDIKSKNISFNKNSIKDLQSFLNNNGFVVAKTGAGSPGFENDFFGKKTKKALCDFQVKNKLSTKKSIVCGKYGPNTKAFIEKLTQQ